MKKLIWSAYVVSLIFMAPLVFAQKEAVDDFLGLESEIMPELKGVQGFTSSDLHEKESWKVSQQSVEIDLPGPNKGQGHSLIPWATLDPDDFLSINTWLTERSIKDANPDWKIRLRQADQQELMGKILQCRGTCDVYRGTNKATVQHLSHLIEGDEIKTGKDSVAWIYLMDGSLMRVSPESSVSMHEFNIGKTEIFILARLNEGHLFWHARSKKEAINELAPETDSFSLPLLVREANQGHFEKEIFRSQNDDARLSQVLELDEAASKEQIKKLNSLIAQNNASLGLQTKVMIVAPNATIVAREVSFDFLYLPGGKSYFKKRNTELGEELSLYLRGYTSTAVNTISDNNWNEVESMGRGYSSLTDVPGTLQVLELLTKRIKTIELAREIWVEKFTLPLMEAKNEPTRLAQLFGHTIWGAELDKRFEFLIEYTRRIETTNLRSIENLLAKLEVNGENIRRDLTDDQYRVCLNHYLLGLKSRYDKKKMRVREMNDLQYYAWILKNGKF